METNVLWGSYNEFPSPLRVRLSGSDKPVWLFRNKEGQVSDVVVKRHLGHPKSECLG